MKRVGLTYDLKTDYEFREGDPPDANAEFDHPSTIDVLVGAIESQGYKVEKIGNVSSLLERMNNLDVDIVFNISEGRDRAVSAYRDSVKNEPTSSSYL